MCIVKQKSVNVRVDDEVTFTLYVLIIEIPLFNTKLLID